METEKVREEAQGCGLKHVGGKDYCCPVELTLQVIGGKWKPVILYHLGRRGTLRFGEIKKSMSRITQKMLTQQLRELEADGMLSRMVYAQVPPRVDYTLTELGESVMPVLKELCRWGGRYEKLLKEREAAEQAA